MRWRTPRYQPPRPVHQQQKKAPQPVSGIAGHDAEKVSQMSAPKHRRPYSVVRELNKPPHSGRHADSIVTRLGAAVFDVDEFRDLLHAIGPGNPFRGRAS